MSGQNIIEIESFQKYINQLEAGYNSVSRYLYGSLGESNTVSESNNDYIYFKISTILYEENNESFERVIYALYSVGCPFSVIFKSVKGKKELYIGAEQNKITEVYHVLNGSFRIISADIENKENSPLFRSKRNVFSEEYIYSGVIRGGVRRIDHEKAEYAVIDSIYDSLLNEDFSVVITAQPFSRQDIFSLLDDWSDLKNKGDLIKSRQMSVHDDLHTISYTDLSPQVSNYLKVIEGFYNRFQEALSKGLWETSVKYYAKSEVVADTVSGLIVAGLYDENAGESIHRIGINGLKYNDYVLINRIPVKVDEGEPMVFPLFSNWYTTDELSAVAELPKLDTVGLQVEHVVKFDLSRMTGGNLSLGKVLSIDRSTTQDYWIDINELNRHALIVGLTGGGKTNTIKNILVNLRNASSRIPFMVIEPTKKEYWELYKLGFDDLKIYSFGGRNKFYINPFQRSGNVSIQTHIDYVFSAFKASFIMYPPMPYVLERAIYEIYEDCGWDIGNNYNPIGDVYPTIEQLYIKIPLIVADMGYDQREQKNISGALLARINSLRIGTKGNCLNVKESIPIENILSQNAIVEMEDIGDEEIKAFLISLVLVQVMEYRMSETDSQKELRHLILLEEAHRLLKNIPSGTGENADPRGNAVEMFCNMLAELRSKGQGFVIADQIPSKLAPDVIKNTNLKIIHRLVSEDDRELVGKSTHMSDSQIDYLATLSQGVGAVYSEGDYIPKIIKANYAGLYLEAEKSHLNHDDVQNLCKNDSNSREIVNQTSISHICALCPLNCNGEKAVIVEKNVSEDEFSIQIERFKESKDSDTISSVVIDILKEVLPLVAEEKNYWAYSFCIIKRIADQMNLSKAEQEAIFVDIQKNISCLSEAPKIWRDRWQ